MTAASGLAARAPGALAPPGAISPQVLQAVIARLGHRCGLAFGAHNRGGLVQALEAAREWFRLGSAGELPALVETPEGLDWLVRTLTIGETYFFRVPEQFAFLKERVVPELVRTRAAGPVRAIRAWSAGCATGEEAYSIAIALRDALPDPDRWSLRVLGTDLNREFLERAAEARYSEWSLRGVGELERRRWFVPGPGPGLLTVRPEVRRLVQFHPANLVALEAPDAGEGAPHVDVLFCRNVFIYFEPEVAAAVVRRLVERLAPGGWAFFGPSDPLPPRIDGLEPVGGPTRVAFRRTDGAPRRARTVRAPSPVRPPPTRPAPDAEPVDVRELRRRAEAHVARGDVAQATRWGSAWVSREPDSTEALLLLATVRSTAGDADEAIALLRRALYFDPSAVLANYRLAELLAGCGRVAEARGCLTNALAQLAAMEDDATVPGSLELRAGALRDAATRRLASMRGAR